MRYIIGMGTGRCGSLSLAQFLNAQKNCTFSHEKMDVSFWPVFNPYPRAMKILKGYGGKWKGDISPGWSAWAHKVLDKYPKSKVIWLYRDCQEVAESFYVQKKAKKGWLAEFESDENKFRGVYPVWEYEFSREAIQRAVDRCFWLCKAIAAFYQDRVYVYNTVDLNSEIEQTKLLDWLGFPEKDWVLGMPWVNKREEYLDGTRSAGRKVRLQR